MASVREVKTVSLDLNGEVTYSRWSMTEPNTIVLRVRLSKTDKHYLKVQKDGPKTLIGARVKLGG